MTPDEIAADRAVIDAATGGEWSTYGYEVRADFPDGDGCRVAGYVEEFDAAFIAAARTGWPRALDEVERLQEYVSRARAAFLTATDIYIARAESAEAQVTALRERIADLEGQFAMRGTP